MRLGAAEWQDLYRLLRLAQGRVLSRSEEHRLRFLLSTTNPRAARMNLVELMHLGFYVVGLHELQRIVQEQEAGVTA